MPTTHVTAPDGTQIAWERSGAGPALILVDGAAMHRGFGTSPAPARLLCDTFSVVTYDRWGAAGAATPRRGRLTVKSRT
jgi:hypothetical protein